MTGWDDRFQVLATKDNQRVHRRFKEFFDKPSARIERLSPQSRKFGYIPGPNLRASLEKHTAREPRVPKKAARSIEKNWDQWFTTLPSLKNELDYPPLRSLFSSPEKPRAPSPEESIDSFYAKLGKDPPRRPRPLFAKLRTYHCSSKQHAQERQWIPDPQAPSFLNECSHQLRRSYFARPSKK